MADEGRKQDQDKSKKVEKVNPSTCWSASIVDSFTICQGMEKEKRGTNPDLEKLIEVFKSGDKNKIDGYLEKTPLNLKTLNEDAKNKYNRESLLHLALKYENTIGFFKTVLNHNPEYLMEQRSNCDKETKKDDKQYPLKNP